MVYQRVLYLIMVPHLQVQSTKNGIADVKTAPYHPSSNGQVERYVQTFKRALKKAFEEDGDTKINIDRLLFSYRTTPHTASM